MRPTRKTIPWPLVLILTVLAVLLLLSLSSGVWALPGQHSLRQTVPTRTPGKPDKTPETGTPDVRQQPYLVPSSTPLSRARGGDSNRSPILFAAGALVVVGCVAYVIMRRGATGGP